MMTNPPLIYPPRLILAFVFGHIISAIYLFCKTIYYNMKKNIDDLN